VQLHDVLRSGNTEIEVVGISSGGNFAFTTVGFMDLEDVKGFLTEMSTISTFFLVQLKDGTDPQAWITELEDEHPEMAAFTSDEFASSTRRRILDDVVPIMLLIVGLAFIVGIAITSLTIFTTTVEKTREFAVMKAIGFNNYDLFQLVLFQSFLIGLLGFVFGAILTLILSRFVDRIVAQFIVFVRWQDLGLVLVATMIMAFAAAIVPARRVGSLDPGAVFRG
jgi:putative ABC transport system permease protein